ncbi:MAG: VWA domain-containing protein, partial [Acidobacteriota bacterium]
MIKRIQIMTVFAALIWLWGTSLAYGQTPEPEQKQTEAIRVEIALVTVPVSVTDNTGRFITGLKQTDFKVFEDAKQVDIAGFAATEEPFNVALLIDTSRSTSDSLGAIRKAARSFIDQLQENDRVLIVAFDERVKFIGDFTSDRRQLQKSISSIKTSYLTSIYDAMSRTISEKLAPLTGRKAIVVFSDGVDTWSKQSTSETTLDLVARSGVLVYSVQYFGGNVAGPPTSPYLVPRRYFTSSLV